MPDSSINNDILSNYVLITTLIAWFLAQLLKLPTDLHQITSMALVAFFQRRRYAKFSFRLDQFINIGNWTIPRLWLTSIRTCPGDRYDRGI